MFSKTTKKIEMKQAQPKKKYSDSVWVILILSLLPK